MILPLPYNFIFQTLIFKKNTCTFKKRKNLIRGSIMSNIVQKPTMGSWVQTEREAHEAWAKLIRKSPKAAELMHLITARIGQNNAVVMSIPTIMRLMSTSRPTVIRAINLLREDRWVQTVQLGGSGTTNAYVVNDRVAWTGPRDGIRFSRFSATVIATDEEQDRSDQLDNQPPLRKLPKVGEIQLPHGDGIAPPSQPFLEGLEPEIPSIEDEDDYDQEQLRWDLEQLAKMDPNERHPEEIELEGENLKSLIESFTRSYRKIQTAKKKRDETP